MDTKQPDLNIDLARMREAALHAQVQGYVFKSDGSQVRQVLDYLHERTLEIESQHARIAELEALAAGYDAARLENASLQAQLEAIGAGGVEPLRKRECLHQISEPASGEAERAAFVAYLTEKFPTVYSEGAAEHWWDKGHVSALAWQGRAALAAQAQPVGAVPAVDLEGAGFFVFSDDGGFERCDTAKEARAAAQEIIDELRTEAGTDEWSMSVESVCWGVVMERSTEVKLEPVTYNEECADYVLKGNASPQPAAQAAPVDATVQRDAARYRFLRDGEWRRTDLESVIRLQLNTLWDSKIDAAIAAQQGGA